MTEFLIGEVEALTGVKAHTLRYWEEVVPFITPNKDNSGRRLYTKIDVRVIIRLNHLINVKKYSIEGAKTQILAEANTEGLAQSIIPELNHIRSDLMDLYVALRKRKKERHEI